MKREFLGDVWARRQFLAEILGGRHWFTISISDCFLFLLPKGRSSFLIFFILVWVVPGLEFTGAEDEEGQWSEEISARKDWEDNLPSAVRWLLEWEKDV